MDRRLTRPQLHRRCLARRIIATACWLTIGFSVGIIVTLKVVGFS